MSDKPLRKYADLLTLKNNVKLLLWLDLVYNHKSVELPNLPLTLQNNIQASSHTSITKCWGI